MNTIKQGAVRVINKPGEGDQLMEALLDSSAATLSGKWR